MDYEEIDEASAFKQDTGDDKIFNLLGDNFMFQKGFKFINRLMSGGEASNLLIKEVRPVAEESGLYCIKRIPKNPFDLFKSWHNERTGNNIQTNALCFSTATKAGRVSSRNLILRRLDEDGFVIMTDKRSKKCSELKENPYAAMTFLWLKEENGEVHSRQVRAEGLMTLLKEEDWLDIYSEEPLFCKIRAYICHQGTEFDWEKMKKDHDTILDKWFSGETQLEKPDHVVAYKMKPEMMEFYETSGPRIADRVTFLKQENNTWLSKRIAA